MMMKLFSLLIETNGLGYKRPRIAIGNAAENQRLLLRDCAERPVKTQPVPAQ
jgi:hypothetical protein